MKTAEISKAAAMFPETVFLLDDWFRYGIVRGITEKQSLSSGRMTMYFRVHPVYDNGTVGIKPVLVLPRNIKQIVDVGLAKHFSQRDSVARQQQAEADRRSDHQRRFRALLGASEDGSGSYIDYHKQYDAMKSKVAARYGVPVSDVTFDGVGGATIRIGIEAIEAAVAQ